MGIDRLAVPDFMRESRRGLILDVRSPGEFNHAHIPGAVNLPLFSDEERKTVGTAYKQQSRELAIKAGLEFFGPRMRSMVEAVEALLSNMPGEATRQPVPVFVHCWRGGMRSGAVAWLLDLYGFKVSTLAGGYKAFRKEVLAAFNEPYPFRVVGGLTGSGKTELLHQLEKEGEAVIDLEGLASHKGSAFGNYNMPPQPGQEMFENLLAIELWKKTGKLHPSCRKASVIWIEDESQRIGDINLPGTLWLGMRRSPLFFLELPFEERLEHITEEYKDCRPEKLLASIQRISKRLGPLETRHCLEFIQAGQAREAFRILLHYYDKVYLKGLHNRENLSALLTRIPLERVSASNALMLTKYQTV
ncbi:MAG TPA: tRNA 2-selenouridine(34) synthase MnmH [Flavisolibacter sp.]|nr:tRNA 2-selenouridine(34) synthase MnmH [Flavisolibacter sp.]